MVDKTVEKLDKLLVVQLAVAWADCLVDGLVETMDVRSVAQRVLS